MSPRLIAVTIYTSGPSCMACTQTKRHLDRRAIPYTEKPINEPGNLDAAIELGFTTSPVVFVATSDGEYAWDGYRPDRIDALTHLERKSA